MKPGAQEEELTRQIRNLAPRWEQAIREDERMAWRASFCEAHHPTPPPAVPLTCLRCAGERDAKQALRAAESRHAADSETWTEERALLRRLLWAVWNGEWLHHEPQADLRAAIEKVLEKP